MSNLIDMRIEGDISVKEYCKRKKKSDEELAGNEKQLQEHRGIFLFGFLKLRLNVNDVLKVILKDLFLVYWKLSESSQAAIADR